MALKLHVALNKVLYEPGEVVHATVQVINDPETSIPLNFAHVKEVSFQAYGTERTDPHWISKLYRPEGKVEQIELRKNVRTIFKTESSVLQPNTPLAPKASQHFRTRFCLPASLPPSFRGTSIKFAYAIDVKAVYELFVAGSPGVVYETTVTTALLIWPSSTSHVLDRRPSYNCGSALSASAMASAPSTAMTSSSGAVPNDATPVSPKAAAATAPGHATTAADASEEPELPVIDYRIQQTGLKIRALEVPSRGDMSASGRTTSGPGGSAGGNSHRQSHQGGVDPFTAVRGSHNQLNSNDSDDSDTEAMPRTLQSQLSSASFASARGSLMLPSHQQHQRLLFGKAFILNAREFPVMRVTLQAPLEGPLQPGATFGGLLDFRSHTGHHGSPPPVRCHHLAIMLETEELVAAEFRAKAGKGQSGAIRKLHMEYQEMTTDLAMSHFIFSIPATATPSFRTPMVSLRWVLRFELMVGPPLCFATMDHSSKQKPELQQLVWSLPLTIVSPTISGQK